MNMYLHCIVYYVSYHILIVLYSKYVIFIHVMFSSTDSEGLPGRCVPANTRHEAKRALFSAPRHGTVPPSSARGEQRAAAVAARGNVR